MRSQNNGGAKFGRGIARSVVKAGGIFDACIERFPLKTSSVHRSDGTNGWKCWNSPIKQRNLYECHLDERCNRLTGGKVGIRIITCPFVFPQSNVNHERAIWIRGWGVCVCCAKQCCIKLGAARLSLDLDRI